MTAAAPRAPTRIVHCADALPWLRARAQEPSAARAGTSVVTSLPDVSEVGLSLDAWRAWFSEAARLCIDATGDNDVTIFFQTDIKKGGVWIDKSALVLRAMEHAGAALLFRKVVCRRPPGSITFGRPAYTHFLCASRSLRPKEPIALPDVIADAGRLVWTRAIGVDACALALQFVRKHAGSTTILDPFCGHGTIPAVANALGLDAIGVEFNRKRAALSRNLRLEL